jgi:FtsH-binding integral membrane protein
MTTKTIHHTNHINSFKPYLKKVFGWVFIGLAFTTAIAYYTANIVDLFPYISDAHGLTFYGKVAVFAPLSFVILIPFEYRKYSMATLAILFFTYAGLLGASLGFIFRLYTSASAHVTLGIVAVIFGLLALYGYISKADLTKTANVFILTLLSLLIAGIANVVLGSSNATFIASFIVLIIFFGLLLFDFQRLKSHSEESQVFRIPKYKLGLLGALTLYVEALNFPFVLIFHFSKGNNQGK